MKWTCPYIAAALLLIAPALHAQGTADPLSLQGLDQRILTDIRARGMGGVVPSPFHAYPVDRPLYTYVQIYDLVKDADGKTLYRVRYFLTPLEEGEPLPVINPDDPGGKTSLLFERSREGTEDFASEFGTLDISDVDSGRYLLTIAVTDRRRVQTVMAQRELEAFEP